MDHFSTFFLLRLWTLNYDHDLWTRLDSVKVNQHDRHTLNWQLYQASKMVSNKRVNKTIIPFLWCLHNVFTILTSAGHRNENKAIADFAHGVQISDTTWQVTVNNSLRCRLQACTCIWPIMWKHNFVHKTRSAYRTALLSEPRPLVTCIQNFAKLGHGFWDMRAD